MAIATAAGCSAKPQLADSPTSSSAAVEWNWGPATDAPRSAFSTVGAQGFVYSVGGTWWDHADGAGPTKKWLAGAQRFGAAGQKWSALPNYPTPIAYALTVAYGQKLVVVGGSTRDGEDGFTSEVYTFDLSRANSAWQRGPALPGPAARIRGGIVGSRILAVIDANFAANPGDAGVWQLDLDGSHRGWEKLGESNQPTLSYRCGAVCAGRLYLFGGGELIENQAIRLSAEAASFSPETRRWRPQRPLPVAMRDMTAATLDDRYILITGGVEHALVNPSNPDENPQPILSHRSLLYDTQADQYQPLASLPLAVADHGAAAVSSRIFIVAGEDSIYRTRTNVMQVGTLSP